MDLCLTEKEPSNVAAQVTNSNVSKAIIATPETLWSSLCKETKTASHLYLYVCVCSQQQPQNSQKHIDIWSTDLPVTSFVEQPEESRTILDYCITEYLRDMAVLTLWGDFIHLSLAVGWSASQKATKALYHQTSNEAGTGRWVDQVSTKSCIVQNSTCSGQRSG